MTSMAYEPYGARGFRAVVLYRDQEWYDTLEFEYGPQRGAVAGYAVFRQRFGA